LRHLPSGYPQVNTAWMWGALLAASIADWLHLLTAAAGPGGRGDELLEEVLARIRALPATTLQ
jgi:hypothetical protein